MIAREKAMHEYGIIEEVVKLALDELKQAEFEGKIKVLKLEVGRLSGASPEALQFAFEMVQSKVPQMQGAILEILEPKPTCICHDCGKKNIVEGFVLFCPDCESQNIEVVGATDLRLSAIDVDDVE